MKLKTQIAVHLTMTPEEGGKFQFSIALLEGLASLDQERYEVTVFCIDEGWRQFVPPGIAVRIFRKTAFSKAIRRLVLTFPGGLLLWRRIGRLIDPFQKQVHGFAPALVFYPGDYEYSFENSLPSVVPIFDLMHRYERSFPEVSADGIFRKRERIYKKVCRYSKAILVDSSLGRTHVIESYEVDPRKILVLPYVAPSYICRLEGSNCSVKYGLPEEYVFYPAQFWKHKNHEVLLDAITLLKSEGLIVNAVFVGARKNYYDNVRQRVESLGLEDQVFILDYVENEELVYLYKHAIALVMPTSFGPTNIPPLEAFALGCAVATSRIYGIPEQVGDAALLFDPGNPVEVAEAIRLLWRDKKIRETLISKGYERARLWNQETYNKRLRELTEGILENNLS